MTDTTQNLTVQVVQAQSLNPLVRHLVLRAPDGSVLPGYTAGAHIQVRVQGARDGDWRHYSLVHLDADPNTPAAPRQYDIAVRLEADGRGGSRYMHEAVAVGDRLEIQPPKNAFELAPQGPVLLLAGGIGITPLASMASACVQQGRDVRMVYAGRSRTLMAFLPQLENMLGERLQVHADDEAGGPLDLAPVLDACALQETVHVCGPTALLDAALAGAQARGWPRERVRFEIFNAPQPQADDTALDVVLAQSNKTVQVPPGQSILDALIDAGCDPLYDCKRGECGVCQVDVIEGDIDHRDHVLSAAEKAQGKVMQICVSRARGKRLVLDL